MCGVLRTTKGDKEMGKVVMNIIRDMNPNTKKHIYEVYAYGRLYQFLSYEKAKEFYDRAKEDILKRGLAV